jgi:hypothetical protein
MRDARLVLLGVLMLLLAGGIAYASVTVAGQEQPPSSDTGANTTETPEPTETPTETELSKQDVLQTVNTDPSEVSADRATRTVAWLGNVQNAASLSDEQLRTAVEWVRDARDTGAVPESNASSTLTILDNYAPEPSENAQNNTSTNRDQTTETPTESSTADETNATGDCGHYRMNDATCIENIRFADGTAYITVDSEVPQRVRVTDSSGMMVLRKSNTGFNIPYTTHTIPSGETTIQAPATVYEDEYMAVTLGFSSADAARYEDTGNPDEGGIQILPSRGSQALAMGVGLLSPPLFAILLARYKRRQRQTTVRRVTDT